MSKWNERLYRTLNSFFVVSFQNLKIAFLKMEAPKDQILERARKVLHDPRFKKLSPENIQKAFKSLIALGLTKEEILAVMRTPAVPSLTSTVDQSKVGYLERLPRDVFKHMVEVGEIQGKDLVHLCNSSPTLRNYCLADRVDRFGQVLATQEIYRIALQKMGIVLKEGEIPSEKFVKVASGIHNLVAAFYGFDPLPVIEQISDNARNAKSYNDAIFVLDANDEIIIYYFKPQGLSRIGQFKLKGIPKIKDFARIANLIGLVALDGTFSFANLVVSGPFGTNRFEKLELGKSITTFRVHSYEVRTGNSIPRGNQQIKFQRIERYGSNFYLLDQNHNLYELPADIEHFKDEIPSINLLFQNVHIFSQLYTSIIYLQTLDGEFFELKKNKQRGPFYSYNQNHFFSSDSLAKKIVNRDESYYLLENGVLDDLDAEQHFHVTGIKDFAMYGSRYHRTIYAVGLDGKALRIGLHHINMMQDMSPGFFWGNFRGETQEIPGISSAVRVITTYMDDLDPLGTTVLFLTN
jgi:hypothetical protein